MLIVDDNSGDVVYHPMPHRSASGRKIYCRLRLREQYGPDGNLCAGKCSKICPHGIMAITRSFDMDFPYIINGALACQNT